MHNVSDNVNFPGMEQTIQLMDPNITSFGINPFDSLLWSGQQRQITSNQ